MFSGGIERASGMKWVNVFFYFDAYLTNYKRLIHLRRVFFSPFSHFIIG